MSPATTIEMVTLRMSSFKATSLIAMLTEINDNTKAISTAMIGTVTKIASRVGIARLNGSRDCVNGALDSFLQIRYQSRFFPGTSQLKGESRSGRNIFLGQII